MRQAAPSPWRGLVVVAGVFPEGPRCGPFGNRGISGKGIRLRFRSSRSLSAVRARRPRESWGDGFERHAPRGNRRRRSAPAETAADAADRSRRRIEPAARHRDQRACLAGQRDRPQNRARRLSARHHPSQRGEMVRDLRGQPLGGARGDQDADGQEPASLPAQDRQPGRAARALEPARPRRARLVRDVAGPRDVPADRPGVPPHHRAGGDRACRQAPLARSRWSRSALALPRDGHRDVAARAHRGRHALSPGDPARFRQRPSGAARRADRIRRSATSSSTSPAR